MGELLTERPQAIKWVQQFLFQPDRSPALVGHQLLVSEPGQHWSKVPRVAGRRQGSLALSGKQQSSMICMFGLIEFRLLQTLPTIIHQKFSNLKWSRLGT